MGVLVLSVAGSAILGHQLGSSTAKPAAGPAKQLAVIDPYAAGGSWYKGNLHVASVRGVGKDLPKALGDWYAAHGYAFLGISDMNTYTWPEEYGSRALPGVATVDATYPFADLLAIGIDPLTAYLATSPGGSDSVAIIAASSNVDVSFVMAMQTVRMIAVLFIGPVLTKYIVTHSNPVPSRDAKKSD